MCVIYSECVGHTHDYEQERGIQSTGERKVLVCTRLKCIFPVFPERSQKTRPCRGYKSMLEKDQDVPYLRERTDGSSNCPAGSSDDLHQG